MTAAVPTHRHRLLLGCWALLVIALSIRALARGLLGDRRGGELAIHAVMIDLNRASVAELTALPGIGAERAEAIVLDRIRRGSFRAVEDLDRVDGLGPGTLDLARPFVECRVPDRGSAR